MQKIWRIKEPDPALSLNLASKLEIPVLIAQLLVNRGISDEQSAYNFLHPDFSQLNPPDKMIGVAESVQRIHQAIANHEKIVIYGDYDVDGITSTCLMFLCLKHLGADATYYIPRRFEEGYGLNNESLADLKQKGCDLLLTVDCGISSVKEIKFANESGIQVIITDHHEPSRTIPPAYAIINPKLKNSEYPYNSLAGVGVAFKLAQALMDDFGIEDGPFLMNNLDLVALGTIADIVPLTGENRVIAALGLEALNKSDRAGIKALCAVASTEQGKIDSGTVSFRLAPRINAAGRMDTALNAVRMLLADSYAEAFEIAQKLDNANKERQSLERVIVDKAKKQVEQLDVEREKAFVLAGEKWHSGTIGIAASKIQEQFYKPTVLISIEGDMGRGSARSIPEFDIHDAIEKCSDLLEKFGGHKAAAGFSIRKENIEKFRNDFLKIASDTISREDLQPKMDIDVKASLSDITMDFVQMLSLLEPYGLGNPEPLIAVNDLSLKGLPKVVGKNSEHLQALVTNGNEIIRTIAFNMAKLERELSSKDVKIDLACRPYINSWNDTTSVQLKIEDVIIHHHDGTEEVTVASAEVADLAQIKIADFRNIPDKRLYLQKLVSKGDKILMYVRDDPAVNQLNKMISACIPQNKLGLCYNITSEDEADRMKAMLIEDELRAIVSSVPFEEPLEGLKHLVFCHPVPTKDLFVASCSPAIEASDVVHIHLIFNSNDVELLTTSLNCQYPNRKLLANVYRKIKDLHSEKNNAPVPIEDLLAGLEFDDHKEVVVSSCIDIFEELGFVKRQQMDGKIMVSIPSDSQIKRDLKESQIFSHGNKIKSEWTEFSQFILRRTAEEFHKMILEHF